MTPIKARKILDAACARYTTVLDGPGRARRGWCVTRGAKTQCWLGSTAVEAVERLTLEEQRAATGEG